MENQSHTSQGPDVSAIRPEVEATISTIVDEKAIELRAFNQMISAIQSLPEKSRSRLIDSVLTFMGLGGHHLPDRAIPSVTHGSGSSHSGAAARGGPALSSFSEDRTITPKEFMFEKKPITDVERVVCLAYYLTHYRNVPHFKTLDLSKLNTEAAQIKFSNPAKAVDNAAMSNLLVAAGKGAKQISSLGELYVQNLPDRVAAKEAVAQVRPRRKNRRSQEIVQGKG